MTKFQFILELTTIINALLLADVTGCTINEIRGFLNCLFDAFEEDEGTTPRRKNTTRDLKHYSYIVDSLHEQGYELWLEDKGGKNENDKKTGTQVAGTDTPLQESEQFCTNQYYQKLGSIINALTEYERQMLFR